MELLRTPDLVLRTWADEDLGAFHDIYSRRDVVRWLGPHPRVPDANPDASRERLHRWALRQARCVPPQGLWAVVPVIDGRADGPPAGTVMLLPLADADGDTGLLEVGWHLHPDQQGRGLATRAARALLAAAADAGVRDVLALTDPDNTRSQAVARRLGMTDQGLTDRWFGLTTRQFSGTIAPGRS